MEMIKFKVIVKCPECWNGVRDSCMYCNGAGKLETELDLDSIMFEIAGRLRHYAYIHDHGE